MLNIPEYRNYSGETKIALMVTTGTGSAAF